MADKQKKPLRTQLVTALLGASVPMIIVTCAVCVAFPLALPLFYCLQLSRRSRRAPWRGTFV